MNHNPIIVRQCSPIQKSTVPGTKIPIFTTISRINKNDMHSST